MRSSVVLPAPLAPVRRTNCPGCAANARSVNSARRPRRASKASTSNMVCTVTGRTSRPAMRCKLGQKAGSSTTVGSCRWSRHATLRFRHGPRGVGLRGTGMPVVRGSGVGPDHPRCRSARAAHWVDGTCRTRDPTTSRTRRSSPVRPRSAHGGASGGLQRHRRGSSAAPIGSRGSHAGTPSGRRGSRTTRPRPRRACRARRAPPARDRPSAPRGLDADAPRLTSRAAAMSGGCCAAATGSRNGG
mmetsp:Transcript_39095/g.91619  ORF Transcript_39095/g.91619 Transcript_39095/m.91619 type:complete len:244 (-) Transcript_39095:105-836(-)